MNLIFMTNLQSFVKLVEQMYTALDDLQLGEIKLTDRDWLLTSS